MDRRPAGRCAVHHHDLSGGNPRRSCRKAAAALLLKRRPEPYSQTISTGACSRSTRRPQRPTRTFSRRRAGRPTAPLDLMIAAVARANGAGVVTRDIGGFEDCGVPLVDPWQALS